MRTEHRRIWRSSNDAERKGPATAPEVESVEAREANETVNDAPQIPETGIATFDRFVNMGDQEYRQRLQNETTDSIVPSTPELEDAENLLSDIHNDIQALYDSSKDKSFSEVLSAVTELLRTRLGEYLEKYKGREMVLLDGLMQKVVKDRVEEDKIWIRENPGSSNIVSVRTRLFSFYPNAIEVYEQNKGDRLLDSILHRPENAGKSLNEIETEYKRELEVATNEEDRNFTLGVLEAIAARQKTQESLFASVSKDLLTEATIVDGKQMLELYLDPRDLEIAIRISKEKFDAFVDSDQEHVTRLSDGSVRIDAINSSYAFQFDIAEQAYELRQS